MRHRTLALRLATKHGSPVNLPENSDEKWESHRVLTWPAAVFSSPFMAVRAQRCCAVGTVTNFE
jgi:hypothetical protein